MNDNHGCLWWIMIGWWWVLIKYTFIIACFPLYLILLACKPKPKPKQDLSWIDRYEDFDAFM